MCMSIGLDIENGFLALRPHSGGSKPEASMGLQARPIFHSWNCVVKTASTSVLRKLPTSSLLISALQLQCLHTGAGDVRH